MKIRHYGILSSRNKPKLKALQSTLGIDREVLLARKGSHY